MPKLFLELVGDPAALVSALLGNVGKHAMPSIFLDLIIMGDGSSALDETKLAGGGCNELRWTLGQEAAVGTGLAANAQRAALRAFNELALVAALPLRMLGSSSSQIRIERPHHAVLWQAVPEDGAGVVEDHDVALAEGRPQSAADHLPDTGPSSSSGARR